MYSRVLVVDDDREVRLLARAVLERRGFEVDEAADAQGALAILERGAHHVVVLDHDLGDRVTGLELASVIAVSWPEVRTIMFSARLEDGLQYPDVDAVVNKATFSRLADEVARLRQPL